MSRYQFLFFLILFSGCAARREYLPIGEREKILKTFDGFGLRVFAHPREYASISSVTARIENRTSFAWEVRVRCHLAKERLWGLVFVTNLEEQTVVDPWELKNVVLRNDILRKFFSYDHDGFRNVKKYVWFCEADRAEAID